MNSVDGLQVLTVLGVVWFGVEGVPLLGQYDIWGDGGGNFVNGSEVIGGERNGKGKCNIDVK